jgi:hypothetical protein
VNARRGFLVAPADCGARALNRHVDERGGDCENVGVPAPPLDLEKIGDCRVELVRPALHRSRCDEAGRVARCPDFPAQPAQVRNCLIEQR